MGDNLISRCKIAAKDCLLYNTEKVSEYGKIYMEAADRIEELEAQLAEIAELPKEAHTVNSVLYVRWGYLKAILEEKP